MTSNIQFADQFINRRLIKIFNVNPQDYPLSDVSELGYFPHARHHYFKRENGAHENILIVCTQGAGTVEVESHKYLLGPGSYIIIPKEHRHVYYSNSENPWSIYWSHFSNLQFDVPTHGKTNALAFNSIIGVFKSVTNMAFSSRESIDYLNTAHRYIMATLCYHQLEETQNSHIQLAIQYMKDNVRQLISLQDIAHFSGLSSSHLSSLFKKYLNISPYSYYLKLKIEFSVNLLLTNDLQINQVAQLIGIEDQFYFSRLFKKFIGVSPKTFKNNNTDQE